MDVWHLALYAVAAYLAIQSLVSLMSGHKRRYQQQLLVEIQNEKKKAARAKKKAQAKQKASQQQTEQNQPTVANR